MSAPEMWIKHMCGRCFRTLVCDMRQQRWRCPECGTTWELDAESGDEGTW